MKNKYKKKKYHFSKTFLITIVIIIILAVGLIAGMLSGYIYGSLKENNKTSELPSLTNN